MIAQGGIYATLSGKGVRADGVNFGYDRHFSSAVMRLNGRPQASQSATYDYHLVFAHGFCFRQR
jgi:hypothetical protein